MPNADSVVSDLSERSQETWDATKTCAAGTLREGRAFVRANPVPVVLGMLALGFVLGALMVRKEPTLHERYVSEPLDNLRSILGDLNARAARDASRGSNAAAQALHSLTDKIKRGLTFW